MSSLLMVLRDLLACFSFFDTAYLTDLGSVTGYRRLISLKCLTICLFIMPAVSIPITILRLPNVESGRRPIMKIFKFYSGLFVLVHVRISQCEFDDMVCTWNAMYVIHMVSSTSRGKTWT